MQEYKTVLLKVYLEAFSRDYCRASLSRRLKMKNFYFQNGNKMNVYLNGSVNWKRLFL